MQPPENQIISVSAFLDILNETMAFAFPSVIVEGEVSSFNVNQNKWVFFDLKDGDCTLPCFMPVYQLKVPMEDGMKVQVTGVPKLTKWGKFSFTAKSVSLSGEGALKRAFELLKARLAKEGLFDESRKRLLPKYPQTIGLISSGASAAYADFIKILGTRWGGVSIQLADVQVQGAVAPDQIIGAISYFNQLASPPDVLVIIRGGGSLEDLQAFSTEEVARAVAASRTPTIVGVGHEIDFSLADYAADVRAATPTDAARIVVPDREQVIQSIVGNERRLEQSTQRHIASAHHAIVRHAHVLERFIRLPEQRVQTLRDRLLSAQRTSLQAGAQRLEALRRLLGSYNPEATLNRGYAIVRHGKEVVTRPSQVSGGQSLVIQLAKGSIHTTVNKS